MRVVLITALAVGACARAPMELCDRSAQDWNKFDTAEDKCASVKIHYPKAPIWIDDDGKQETPPIPSTPSNDPRPPSNPPSQPEPPTSSPKPPSVDPNPPSSKGPKGNNGWGNGDQAAPGNSGSNNNAENNTSGKSNPTNKSKGRKK